MENNEYNCPTIDELEEGKSILLTFGEPGRILKKNIRRTAIACQILFIIVFNPISLFFGRNKPDFWMKKKSFAVSFAKKVFPFNLEGKKPDESDHGQILVINHPTLNDPICTIIYALELYPDREVVVPVNLPWYEGIAKYKKFLSAIGVRIVPVLTPATAKRLGTNENISQVQTMLVSNYTAEVAKIIKDGGMAVLAQQATRQRYIFSSPEQSKTGDGILSTISFVLAGLKRSKILDKAMVCPIGIIPYSLKAKAKLNPFRKYTLNVGEPILAADLSKVKNEAKRSADLFVLRALAELIPGEYRVER